MMNKVLWKIGEIEKWSGSCVLRGKRQNGRHEGEEETADVDGLPATRNHGDFWALLLPRAKSGSVVLPQPGSV